jgi:cellulose synthase/poly-beta-1,6-N-acetylglucosamine synthase-like glycosyltransferase
MKALFWISVSLVFYTYFLYPALLLLVSGLKQLVSDRSPLSHTERRSDGGEDLPDVSVVIAAYNEEDCIAERIQNLQELDYPAEKLSIWIGSDGSSDRTPEILSSYQLPNLNVRLFEQNRGKMCVLNDLVDEIVDDVLVMTDANTHFEADAIRCLVRHFEDKRIGAVCGELDLVQGNTKGNSDSIYWRYERLLKLHESKLGALLGANGAIYAIRKSLFQPLPADTIVDDFQIVMNVAKAGFRIHYDPEARAVEEIAPDLIAERGRRVRIGAGNYQAFGRLLWALNPLLGWRFVAYISHKVCRWFVPHLLIIALATNIALMGNQLYLSLLLCQIVFYSLAWRGISRLRNGKAVNSIESVFAFFVSMNMALLTGFIQFLSTESRGSWQRTAR